MLKKSYKWDLLGLLDASKYRKIINMKKGQYNEQCSSAVILYTLFDKL